MDSSTTSTLLSASSESTTQQHNTSNCTDDAMDENESSIQWKSQEQGRDKTHFPFRRLPIEMRNEIYRLILVMRYPIDPVLKGETATAINNRRMRRPRGGKGPEGRDQKLGEPPVSVLTLLEVCQSLYDEAMPIFYGENTFSFSDTTRLFRFIHSIGKERRGHISKICLSFSQKTNPNAGHAFLMLKDEAQCLKSLDISLPYTPMSTMKKLDWAIALRSIRGLKQVNFDLILRGNPREFAWIEEVREWFSGEMVKPRVTVGDSEILSSGSATPLSDSVAIPGDPKTALADPALGRMRLDLVRAKRRLDDKKKANAARNVAKEAAAYATEVSKTTAPCTPVKKSMASDKPAKTPSHRRRTEDEGRYKNEEEAHDVRDVETEYSEGEDMLLILELRSSARKRLRRMIISSGDDKE